MRGASCLFFFMDYELFTSATVDRSTAARFWALRLGFVWRILFEYEKLAFRTINRLRVFLESVLLRNGFIMHIWVVNYQVRISHNIGMCMNNLMELKLFRKMVFTFRLFTYFHLVWWKLNLIASLIMIANKVWCHRKKRYDYINIHKHCKV